MIDIMQFQNYKDVVMGSILDLARSHEDIVFLDSDLASCIGSTAFQQEFPSRFLNCGIAEANMTCVAGGLSSIGYTPFIHSFGCFASRRMYDQLFISIGYAHQTVHVIGSDPGITAQYNGGTHMPFEDIALMRQIPDFVIYEPSDATSLYKLIQQVYRLGKPSYLRTPRKGMTIRYGDETNIQLGKAITLRDGTDVAIIATGIYMVDQAMKAASELAEQGISAKVIDLHTIRPLDTEIITKAASDIGRLVICENSRQAGSIGEMISSYLMENDMTPKMRFVCVGERFGEVGSLEYLSRTFHLTSDDIKQKALETLRD